MRNHMLPGLEPALKSWGRSTAIWSYLVNNVPSGPITKAEFLVFPFD